MLVLGLALLFAVALVALARRRQRALRLRRKTRRDDLSSGRERTKRTPIYSDPFAPDKVPQSLDAVCIGGGIGSLGNFFFILKKK